MNEQNGNTQSSIGSRISNPLSYETTPEADAESPILGYANAPLPCEAPYGVTYQIPNHPGVNLHNWPCSSFQFIPPRSLTQYRQSCRSRDAEKARLDRELNEVTQTLMSYGVSEAEFQAALGEYAAIVHEILGLELRQVCARRVWRVIQNDIVIAHGI
ncbi:hypothetical protein ACLX1H_004777 [Fusarium chlamydosporum]